MFFLNKNSGLYNNLQFDATVLNINFFVSIFKLFPQHYRRGGDYQGCIGEPSGWPGQRGDQVGGPAGSPHANALQQQHQWVGLRSYSRLFWRSHLNEVNKKQAHLANANEKSSKLAWVNTINQISQFASELQLSPSDASSSDARWRGLKGSICPLLFFSAGGFFKSRIIQKKLITSFVPFLPLSRRHVERCVRSQLCVEGLCSRGDVVEAVGGAINYTPVQGHFFSTTGCKAVPAKINLFLWVEEQRIVNGKVETIYEKTKASASEDADPTLGLWGANRFRVKDASWRTNKENRTQKTQLPLCL